MADRPARPALMTTPGGIPLEPIGVVSSPVREPVDLARLFASDTSDLRLVLVEPGSEAGSETGMNLVKARPRPAAATVLIGPEGGWTPDEVQAARQAGFLPVTLGGRTLRADAAGVAAIAILQFVWGDL